MVTANSKLGLKRGQLIRRSLIALLVGLSTAGCDEPEEFEIEERGVNRLSWDFGLRTKMYIATVPAAGCDPITVLGKPPLLPSPRYAAKAAAFLALCAGTNLAFAENPRTGDDPAPGANLDARVLTKTDFKVTCEKGTPIPVAGSVTSAGAIAGIEPPAFKATAFAPKVRDDLVKDGTFAFISSGKPHPVPDLSFQVIRPRARTTIWHKFGGSMGCSTDAQDNPKLTGTVRFDAFTSFPSHRAYQYDRAGKQVKALTKSDVTQGAISGLWFLPAVPVAP
ncbi:MAG: hypothetical protein AAF721_40940 [Myxococcota bacterium]